MTIRAVFFDLAGVLYDTDAVLPGADAALAQARERELILRFVTNTATKSRQQVLDKLHSLGLVVAPEELITAPDAAQRYIQSRALSPYALVHPSIADCFVTEREPDCVVLGDAREDLNYTNLNRAFRLLMDGCPLIGIGENQYFRERGQLSLDAGPFIHALSWAADIRPTIMGKPSEAFFAEVVASTDCRANECLMIGDDVLGDVQGALDAGLQAALVQTGKYRTGDESRLSGHAPVIASVADWASLL